MVFNVDTATVGASAAAETGISAEVGAAAAAAAAPLLTVLPMGADLDSIEFAAALNAAGAAYLASAGEHMVNRGMFAGAQSLTAATSAATEAIRDTELTI
jgi:hypothetical protein